MNIKELQKRRHEKNLADPIYVEGYNGPNHWVAPWVPCPYAFDKQLDLRRMKISMLERNLTADEIELLKKLNEKMRKTKWDRWISGNYYKWCVENA